MKRFFFISFIVTVFIGCEKSETPTSTNTSGVITITADVNTQYQEMDGFGASDAWRFQMIGANWSLEKRNEIADLLFSQDTNEYGNPKGIGLSIWRFNIGAGSAEQGDNSYISDSWRRTECFLNADGSYDWTKQQGQQWFLQAAKARGTEKILGFTNSPPVYYTNNGYAFSPSGWHLNIKSDSLERFAEFLATVAAHFNSEGIPIDYISPVNEPQWSWTAGSNNWASQEGTPAANSDVAELARLLSEKITEKGISTKIALAEAGTVAYLYETTDAGRGNQIADFYTSTSDNYIGNLTNLEKVISSHDYYTVWPVSDLISSRSSIHSKILSTDADVKCWQTEYCILESANTDLADGWDRDLTMDIALYVARIIHYDLTKAYASSWQWWTALSRSDYKDGLIYVDDGTNNGITDAASNPEYCKYDGYIRESKLLWALGNYSLFVRPGMKRILISSPDITPNQSYGLLVTAFIDQTDNKVVTVIINYNTASKKIAFKLKNATLQTSSLKTYTTSDDESLTKATNINADEILLPGNSITTLTGIYN
jgi:O-glycosyl hydrolase